MNPVFSVTGPVQLAALAPCTLLFNFTFYSFSALSVATISLVAEYINRPDQAGDTLTAALISAAFGGLVVGLVMLYWGPTLLRATGCDPSLIPFSWQYLKIRAFAAPAAILTQVCQGGLLAQRDSVNPFKVVLFSLALSLAGDLYLVGVLGMGLVGAALTTVAAQYVSSALLLRSLFSSKIAPTMRFPQLLTFSRIIQRASGLGIFYVAKTTSYLLLQASATRLPPLMLASHQTIWQLWGVCSFMNTPLEQAALTFVPSAPSERDRRELIQLLLSLGATFGIVCALVAHGLPALAPGLLVSDATLWPFMRSVWLPGTLALLACGLDVSSTGVLLASREVTYVARSMLVSLTILAAFFAMVAIRGPLGGDITQLKSVWWGLSIFFLARVFQSFPRAVSKLHTWKNI